MKITSPPHEGFFSFTTGSAASVTHKQTWDFSITALACCFQLHLFFGQFEKKNTGAHSHGFGGENAYFGGPSRNLPEERQSSFARPQAGNAPLWDSNNSRFMAIEDRLAELENRILSGIERRLVAIESSFPAMKREFNDFGMQLSELKRNAATALVPGPAMGPRSRGLPPGFIPPPVLKGVFEDEVEVAGLIADVLEVVNPNSGLLIFDFEGHTYKVLFDIKNFKNKDEIREFGVPGEKFVIAVIGQKTFQGLDFEVVGMVPLINFTPSRIEIAKPGFRRELPDLMGNLNILNKDEAEMTVFLRGLPKKMKVTRDRFVINGTVPNDLTGLTNDRAHCELGKKKTKDGLEYFIVRAWVLGRKRDLEKDAEEGGQVLAKKLCLDKEGWEEIGSYTIKYTPINSSLCRAKLTIGSDGPKDYFFTRSVAVYQGSQVSDFTIIKEKKITVAVEGKKDEKGIYKYRVSHATFPGKDAGRLRFSNVKGFFRAITENKGQARCNVHSSVIELEVPEGMIIENGNVVTDYKPYNGRKDLNCEIVKNAEGKYELKRAWFGKLNVTVAKEKGKGPYITPEMHKQGKKKTKLDKRFRESCIKTATGQFVPTDNKNGVIKFGDKELQVRPPLVWKDKTCLKTFEGVEAFEVNFQYADIPVEPRQESVLLAWSGEEPNRVQDYVAMFKNNLPKYGEMVVFSKVSEKEGTFKVPEVGDVVVKVPHFYLSGDQVKDLKMIGNEKFSFQLDVDEVGNILHEAPVAWIGRKPTDWEGKERILAQIEEFVHPSSFKCRSLTGKLRNIIVSGNATKGPGESNLFDTTNVYDIVEIELVMNRYHPEFFMGINWEKVASGRLKDVPDPEEEDESDEEMETETEVTKATVKSVSNKSLVLSVDGSEAEQTFENSKIELFGANLKDIELGGVFKNGDKFLVIKSEDGNIAKYAFDQETEDKQKLKAKLEEFCKERKVAVKDKLVSQLDSANGSTEAMEE